MPALVHAAFAPGDQCGFARKIGLGRRLIILGQPGEDDQRGLNGHAHHSQRGVSFPRIQCNVPWLTRSSTCPKPKTVLFDNIQRSSSERPLSVRVLPVVCIPTKQENGQPLR